MESEKPSKISYKIREKIRSFKVTFFTTKIYKYMMTGIYIYNWRNVVYSRISILSNLCTTVIEKSTKKVKKKVFPQNPNIFSVGMGFHCKLPDFIAQNIHHQGPQNEFYTVGNVGTQANILEYCNTLVLGQAKYCKN